MMIVQAQNNHVTAYKDNLIKIESKRAHRIIKGNELNEAKARSKRLTFAQMGISTSNLLFDSELAGLHLSPEILAVLKDDPEKDSGIMHTRVPTDSGTSTIGESDRGGNKSLDTDTDDDDQFQFIEAFDVQELECIASASMRIIDRLPLFIHNLKRWSSGFNPKAYHKANAVLARKHLAACVGSDNMTVNGTIRKRKAETKPRRKRVARRSRVTHSNTLMS